MCLRKIDVENQLKKIKRTNDKQPQVKLKRLPKRKRKVEIEPPIVEKRRKTDQDVEKLTKTEPTTRQSQRRKNQPRKSLNSEKVLKPRKKEFCPAPILSQPIQIDSR